jgi:hypothetical protein
MDKQDQDIVWLAQRMGIPPEIALKMFKEGAMNSEPQMGAEPFNFIIEDDRNLPTGSEFPDYVTPDPSGMNVPATSPGIFDWLKGIYGQKANPMQGSGMQMDPQAQALFGMIKKLIGG